MSKTVQEIMEVMGKTVEVTMKLERKNGSSYTHIADITPEDINEIRYYFDGALYRSVMRCLEVKFKGDWTAKAKKGLLLDSLKIKATHPEGDSVTIGYGGFYIAEAPEYDAAQNLTSVIAYDELYQSMRPYTASLWQSGITVKNYLIAILNKLDINYDANSLSLMANADKKITSEKFLDIENDSTEAAYTYRDILDEIAKASGVTFAFKNSLGGDPFKLYAIKPTESGYVIDESNLRSVTIGAKYGPVKGVVLSREPQEDNVYYPSNLSDSQTAVKISNVELIEDSSSDEYRKQFAKGIYDNVTGTEYYLYDLDSFGIGFLNFGDIFTLKVCERTGGMIGDEKEYKTIFMRTDMTVRQGVKEKSKLEAPQATSTDYSAAESASDKLLKKTMIKVDKQEQRITSLVKESNEKFSEFTQTVEGLNGEIVDTKNDLEAKITATASAATSQYTALKTEVKENYVANSTYNTFVNQTAEKFSTQAESIKNIQDEGYITEERCNSLIEAQSDKITLSVEENLKIGTRNILLNSECFAGFTPTKYKVSRAPMVPSISDTYVPSGKYSVVGFDSVLDGESTTRGVSFVGTDILGQSTIDKIKPNTTYTLSFWLRTRSGAQVDELTKYAVIYAGDNAKVTLDTSRSITPTPTESWQKYVLTFKITGTISHFYIRMFFENCKDGTQKPSEADVQYWIDISSFKLEEGNIATDWTPSAEDTEKSVQAKIDMCVKMDENGNLESEINISSDKLTIDTQNFTLAKDGTITCQGATIEGNITATSGSIGGWNIGNGCLSCGYGSNSALFRAPTEDKKYFISVGGEYNNKNYDVTFALLEHGEIITPEISAVTNNLKISTATSVTNRRTNFMLNGQEIEIRGSTAYRDCIWATGGFVLSAGSNSSGNLCSLSLLGSPINLISSNVYADGNVYVYSKLNADSITMRNYMDKSASNTAFKPVIFYLKTGEFGIGE